MTSINVRRSYENDTNSIHALVPELKPLTLHTPYTYWNLFRNFGDSCFVALVENLPVGFITSHPTTTPQSEWFIWQAGILTEYRGTGLIDELQDKVVSVARNSGATAINMSIEADNSRSLGVFTKMATRLGSHMEEVATLNLDPLVISSVPEVLYRIEI